MPIAVRIARFVGPLLPLVGGCDGGDDDTGPELPACVDVDPDGCMPLYEPTFDKVFAQTLLPRCGVAGGACHGEPGADGAALGGLVLAEADDAFSILHDGASAGAYVQPGDAACSLLVVRLKIDDPDLRMPPGTSGLPAGELCSVVQWIEQGAVR